MAGIFNLVYSQEFTSTNTIQITHNSGYEYVKLKVVINNESREDLISSVVTDINDPTNKLTVYLTSVQTGVVQVIKTDFVTAGELSSTGTHRVVYTTGNQTVSGAKNFNGPVTFSGAVSGIDINELDDVNTALASNGQALVYDSGTWLPQTISGTGGAGDPIYFDAYDATGGTDVSSGWTDVPLSTERQKTPEFTHLSGYSEVTINQTDVYVVIARVTVYQSTGNTRSAAQMRLMLDTGTGFTEVDGTYGMMYSRNDAQGESTATVAVILSLEDSDALRVQARRESGVGTINLMAEGSSLTIFPANGPRGSQGDKGDSGAGSAITVQDSGVTIAGSPSDTLNFKACEIDDTVSGTATILPKFGSWYGYTIEDAASSTSSTAWQQKARFSVLNVPAGTYRVGWYYEWGFSNTGRDFCAQVQVDDTNTLAEHREEPQDAGTDQHRPSSGFMYVALTEGAHYVDLDYRSSQSGYTARIRRARIEFWRLS